MTTWNEAQEAKKAFLAAIGTQWPEWFRGVGIGFDFMDAGSYTLVVNVRNDDTVDFGAAINVLVKALDVDNPIRIEIKAVGDIVAL